MAGLITEPYRALQQQLHAAPRGYGERGDKWAPSVAALIVEYDAWSVLDYGCGQGALVRALRSAMDGRAVRFAEYDPAIAGKSGRPDFADLVTCTDVLEHIEPDCLDAVLAHLKMLARKAVFAVISTRTAQKVLSDGRNAHLIVQPGEWWEARLRDAGFTLAPAPDVARKKPAREWIGVLLPC